MMKIGKYEPVYCSISPTVVAISIPPIEPAMPPMPTTEPTARRGNMSDAIVKMFALQPWCAAAARLMSATASHKFEACAANIIGTTDNAQTSIATLRDLFTVQPRLMSDDESQPPPIDPTSAAT